MIEALERPAHAAPAGQGICSPGLRLILQGGYFVVLLSLIAPLAISLGEVRIFSFDVVFLPYLVLVVLLTVLSSWRAADRRWSRVDFLPAALLLLLLVSSLLSVRPLVSLDEWSVWLRAAMFYYLTRHLLRTGELDLLRLGRFLEALWLLLFAVGAIQLASGTDFGLVANYFGAARDQGGGFQGVTRVSGTTPETNVYAQWLVTFSLVVAGRVLFAYRGWVRFAVLGGLVAVQVPVLLATLSRGSLLYFVLGHALLLVVWTLCDLRLALQRFVKLSAFGLLFVLVALVVLQGRHVELLAERMTSDSDSERTAQFQHGREVLEKPRVALFGTGLGAFYPALYELGIPISEIEDWKYFDSRVGIHNVFLRMLVEAGVFPLLAWCLFLVLVIRSALRALRRVRSGPWAGLVASVLCALVGLVLVPMQVYMSVTTYPMLFFVFLLAAMAVDLREELTTGGPLHA